MDIDLTPEEREALRRIEAVGPERVRVFRQHLLQFMSCYEAESQTLGVLVLYHLPSEQLSATVIHGDPEIGAAMLHSACTLVATGSPVTAAEVH